MPFEIDHVGAVVHVETTSKQWSADATLFAVSTDGSRITAAPARMGAAGPRRGIAAIKKRYAGPPLPEDPDARQRALVVLCYSCGVFGRGRSERSIGRWQVWQ